MPILTGYAAVELVGELGYEVLVDAVLKGPNDYNRPCVLNGDPLHWLVGQDGFLGVVLVSVLVLHLCNQEKAFLVRYMRSGLSDILRRPMPVFLSIALLIYVA